MVFGSCQEKGFEMFDSPFEYCLVCKEYVLLDQTQRQCAREHGCDRIAKCPLQQFFAGMEFRESRNASQKAEEVDSDGRISARSHRSP
jgi:hypothetical protein